MTSRREFFALLRFQLRLLPRYILPILAIFSLNACIQGIFAIAFRANSRAGQADGIVTSLNSFPTLFVGLLALQFLIRETGWAGTGSAWLMPAGEFLVTRPIRRRASYLSLTLLYFVILLLPCFLNVGVTLVEPDLRVGLYHGKILGAQAADKLTSYQTEFPDSTLTRTPKAGYDQLVIPFGAVLVALWQLWLAILLALALQTATLLMLPSKVQIALFMTICIAPTLIVILHPWGDPTAALEHVFFFFVHHGVLVALLTLGVFAGVQRAALNRIQHLEFV